MGMQGCGRPPLRQPPLPSPRKPVVWGITTGSKFCGVKLAVKSQFQYIHPAASTSSSSSAGTLPHSISVPSSTSAQPLPHDFEVEDEATTAVDASPPAESAVPPPISQQQANTAVQDGIDMLTLPPALQQRASSQLTQEEFQATLQKFKYLLLRCQAGTARTMLMTWAMIVVVTFMAAYMVPGFWSSTIFSKPWFLLGFGTTQIFLLAVLLCWQRRDVQRLLQDTHELFRPWRRHYQVEVAFYQTSHIAVERLPRRRRGQQIIVSTTARHYRHRYDTLQGSFNFVLVFGIIRPEDVEALELASLDGTAKVEDEDESSSRNI